MYARPRVAIFTPLKRMAMLTVMGNPNRCGICNDGTSGSALLRRLGEALTILAAYSRTALVLNPQTIQTCSVFLQQSIQQVCEFLFPFVCVRYVLLEHAEDSSNGF